MKDIKYKQEDFDKLVQEFTIHKVSPTTRFRICQFVRNYHDLSNNVDSFNLMILQEGYFSWVKYIQAHLLASSLTRAVDPMLIDLITRIMGSEATPILELLNKDNKNV